MQLQIQSQILDNVFLVHLGTFAETCIHGVSKRLGTGGDKREERYVPRADFVVMISKYFYDDFYVESAMRSSPLRNSAVSSVGIYRASPRGNRRVGEESAGGNSRKIRPRDVPGKKRRRRAIYLGK